MARPIVLGNGRLHVGLNDFGLVHDLYFPHVGFENHAAGKDLRHKIGVWVDGHISWLDEDKNWKFSFSYPHAALIGLSEMTNDHIGIKLVLQDTVDAHIDVFMRNIEIHNLREETRDVRIFMHQAFAIGDSRSNTDTGQYLPDSNAIMHYRGNRVLVVSGTHESGAPFDQFTVGLFGIENHEGSHRDADDGELSFGVVEHGRVDSALRFRFEMPPESSQRIHYWIACGESMRDALDAHKQMQDNGIKERTLQTSDWWHVWLQPAYKVIEDMPEHHRKNFINSLMIVKSQIDRGGAIIASTDTSLLNYSRDAYAYCWPRDGALVLWPLIRLGYREEPMNFFRFIKSVLHQHGYVMHKYRADGALGSSWHPYLHGMTIAPPIQEDETALTLFMFSQFYRQNPSVHLLEEFYEELIKPMAEFMTGYIDAKTELPRPSYDLWEEIYTTSLFSTSAVYGALIGAAYLAEQADDNESAVRWNSAAEDIKSAAHKQFFNEERQVFYRGIIHEADVRRPDTTIDNSAIFGAFLFGLYDLGHGDLQKSVETAIKVFGMNNDTIGLPRYENDPYRRESDMILGNNWFITTLWYAQYGLARGDKDGALRILDWAQNHAMSTGVMSEQVDPTTDTIVAPAPLTWTHAEYLSTLLDTLQNRGS